MQQVNKEIEKLRKNVHPVYNEEHLIQKGVKELELRLQTNNWSRQDEMRLIKEIEQVKESKPYFAKIEKIRKQYTELKEQREAIKQSMAPTNKIINSLKERVSKIKAQESVFDNAKQLKQYDLTNLNVKIDKNIEHSRALKNKKYELKEDFYGRMCDY